MTKISAGAWRDDSSMPMQVAHRDIMALVDWGLLVRNRQGSGAQATACSNRLK